MLARDADAIVDDANDNDRMVAVLAAGFVLGDYANHAAFALGRVSGVVQQVEQNLLNFVFVGKRRPQLGRQHGIECHTPKALVVIDDPQGVGNQLIDVDQFLMTGGGASEIYQVLERSGDARDLREDGVQGGAALRVVFARQQ